MKIVGVLAIVIGLILGGVGGFLMFIYVPQQKEDAEFPDDFDEHVVYGGYIDKLDITTGAVPRTDFWIDRHVVNTGKLDNGHYLIKETIKGYDNDTGDELDDLYNYHEYEVSTKELLLFDVTDGTDDLGTYTESQAIHWMFPIPVEKKDYEFWSMNLIDHSLAEYQGEEKRAGVDCYVFYGEETEWEVPLPGDLATMLGPFANDTEMTLTLWEKVWVHPLTGIIVDYAKELKQYIHLPDLPAVPEIVYPSDLESTTGFEGSLVLFDQDTASFVTMNGITAVRTMEVVNADGYQLTADDTVKVYAPDGSSLDLLDSAVQVIFNATNGAHAGLGRTGSYLFPPTGVEKKDYMIWDDGFQMELTAVYMGMENGTFDPLQAYIYEINVEGLPYAAGGTADMTMTYWVEPQTGIVLDVDKQIKNWRAQPARRLPTDTSMINKTVHMNATVTQIDPFTHVPTEMEMVIEQMINCTGYTDMTFSVAKVQETITKYYMDMPMGPPTVSKFGVDAVTMEYVEAENWSTVDRNGALFTFPVGILNETGALPAMFPMYNSDLGVTLPAVLTEETDFQGLDAAVYTMTLNDQPLNNAQLIMALGQDPGLPEATGLYNGSTVYTVDIDTGTILDVQRMMEIRIVPPTYEYLWDTMNSTMSIKGEFMSQNITVMQTMVGAAAGDGTTQLTISETTKYDNGTDFLPPDETSILINTTSHEMLYPNGTGMGLYFLFPPEPTEAGYPMAQTLGPYTMVAPAIRGTETATTVAYNWTGMTVADGALIGMPGVSLNVTMDYNFLVDKYSGMVLDVVVDLTLENMSIPFMVQITFPATEETKAAAALGSAVMGWALSQMPVKVLDVEMSLYDMEVTYNVGKAAYTQGLLEVADGLKPALDLHMYFNGTTKEMMKTTAMETKALLAQIPGLMQLHAIKNLLASQEDPDRVAFVYYKQLETDREDTDYEGSVEYWSDMAKEMEDTLNLYGTTLPIVLYVIAAILILIGIALIVAGPKEEGVEEEEEEEGEAEGTEEGGGEE